MAVTVAAGGIAAEAVVGVDTGAAEAEASSAASQMAFVVAFPLAAEA